MLYRDLRWGYYGAVAAGAAVLLALWWQGLVAPVPALLLLLAWAVPCAMVANRAQGKRLQAVNNLRLECRMEEYEAANLALLEAARRTRNSSSMLILLLNLSTAQLDLGRPEQALSYLRRGLDELARRKGRPEAWVAYYNNLAAYWLRKQDWDRAEEALDGLKGILDGPDLPPARRDALYSHYELHKVLLDMGRGKLDGAEAYFRRALERDRTPIGRVCRHTYLAQLYQRTGETEKQRRSLVFLARNGGDTCYAKAARTVLAEAGLDW